MPNRILRDWTDSEAVNSLTVHAERLFVRLIMKANDYGRLTAHPKLLRAMLFPRTFDQVREADLARWLAECKTAGLIALYGTEAKPLLEIMNFNQRTRSPSKFDAPSLNDGLLPATGGQVLAYSEAKADAETKARAEAGTTLALFEEFFKRYPKKKGREDALKAYLQLNPDDGLAKRINAAVDVLKTSKSWQEDNGQFVPRATDFILENQWERVRGDGGSKGPKLPTHAVVEHCLKTGKVVSPEVLAIYPDLAAKYQPEGSA